MYKNIFRKEENTMKKAAVVVLLLAGVAAVAGEAGIMDGFGNLLRMCRQKMNCRITRKLKMNQKK